MDLAEISELTETIARRDGVAVGLNKLCDHCQVKRKGVQRLPIRIEGQPGEFELINALRLVSRKQLQSPPFQASLKGAQLLRSEGTRPNIWLTRPLAEALAQAEVTGVTFVPIEKSR